MRHTLQYKPAQLAAFQYLDCYILHEAIQSASHIHVLYYLNLDMHFLTPTMLFQVVEEAPSPKQLHSQIEYILPAATIIPIPPPIFHS
ncbi:unnamed protein product [Rodentolepis nana]|uniref:Ovule protein n=1 Tax=Rodentolepis nana TaxID=102285 RepID=A0A0R3T848_RODNA|nr:unnamed protein product [Rodentolepis nana]